MKESRKTKESALMSNKQTPSTTEHGKNKKLIGPLLFYFSLLIVFILFVWFSASYLEPRLADPNTITNQVGFSPFSAFKTSVEGHVSSTLGRLLLQVITILVISRAIGWLFAKAKQPTVIGEIVAGVLLGPSLLGALWPEAFEALFPAESIQYLELLSSFGLILFMYTIGMELRIADIRAQARNALIISQASIFIPFILGMLLAISLYRNHALHVPFFPMILFMGIAMSITAFPVLARIIQERQMSRTPFGKLTLNTAAAGDIFAWLLLAAIMAVSQTGSFASALYNFLFLLLYMGLMFGVVRPLFRLIGKTYHKQELVTKALVAFIFILLLVSAYLTEILSMHALFGAFIFGLVMPEDLKFRHVITEKVEDVSLNLFLPLFFVSSGLKTDLTLINTWEMALLALLVIVVAVVGKVGGTYIGARVCGLSKKNSLYLGAYMNTRGLMELVVLKIGLDLGILPPLLFAILVLMTVVTTIMTTPLIHLIDWMMKEWRQHHSSTLTGKDEILISFGRPETGIALLALAKQIFPSHLLNKGVVAMHATLNSTLSTIDEESYFRENFSPLEHRAKKIDLPLRPLYTITDNVSSSIIEETERGEYKFLLLGAGLSFSSEKSDQEIVKMRRKWNQHWKRITLRRTLPSNELTDLLDERMNRVMEAVNTHVGILISRPIANPPRKILIAITSQEEESLAPYALQMARTNGGQVSILPLDLTASKGTPSREFSTPLPYQNSELEVLPVLQSNQLPSSCDFLFVSQNSWAEITKKSPSLLANLPPTLIIKPSSTINREK